MAAPFTRQALEYLASRVRGVREDLARTLQLHEKFRVARKHSPHFFQQWLNPGDAPEAVDARGILLHGPVDVLAQHAHVTAIPSGLRIVRQCVEHAAQCDPAAGVERVLARSDLVARPFVQTFCKLGGGQLCCGNQPVLPCFRDRMEKRAQARREVVEIQGFDRPVLMTGRLPLAKDVELPFDKPLRRRQREPFLREDGSEALEVAGEPRLAAVVAALREAPEQVRDRLIRPPGLGQKEGHLIVFMRTGIRVKARRQGVHRLVVPPELVQRDGDGRNC